MLMRVGQVMEVVNKVRLPDQVNQLTVNQLRVHQVTVDQVRFPDRVMSVTG